MLAQQTHIMLKRGTACKVCAQAEAPPDRQADNPTAQDVLIKQNLNLMNQIAT